MVFSVVVAGGGDAAEVAVLEPVAVAFEADDVGVMDEAVDHGSGDGVVAEDLPHELKGLLEVTMTLAVS